MIKVNDSFGKHKFRGHLGANTTLREKFGKLFKLNGNFRIFHNVVKDSNTRTILDYMKSVLIRVNAVFWGIFADGGN